MLLYKKLLLMTFGTTLVHFIHLFIYFADYLTFRFPPYHCQTYLTMVQAKNTATCQHTSRRLIR